jgi:flagella basal body P-ring formation protein FlgA
MTRPPHRALFLALAVVVAALALLLGPRVAVAAVVELRSDIAAPNGQVTLGDIFEGAGAAGAVVVGSGAPPGGSLVIDARQLQALAAAHGLQWTNARGMNRLIARVETGPALAFAPAARAVRRRGEEVLTYARDFAAGDVVQPEDVVWAAPSGFGSTFDAPRDARAVIGQAARRPLRAGTAVSLADLGAPKVIKKDDMVQVAYAAGGIKLVLQGKAMSGAAVGDIVDIMNPSSKKTIQAVASGPDQAVVGPEAERIKAQGAAAPRLLASLN